MPLFLDNSSRYTYEELVQQMIEACEVIETLQENMDRHLSGKVRRDFKQLVHKLYEITEEANIVRDLD